MKTVVAHGWLPCFFVFWGAEASGEVADGSKRDFSTAQTDAFAGANAKKRRRLASVEMTVIGCATLDGTPPHRSRVR